MKKLIALVMVCGFALSIVACGGGGTQTEAESVDSVTNEAPAMEPAPVEADSVQADSVTAQ